MTTECPYRSRRAVLATAGVIGLAGCTASEDDDSVSPEDVTVTGIEQSEIYHDYSVQETGIFHRVSVTGSDADLLLNLEFDPDADYYPPDHDVYLLDGQTKVSEGSGEGNFSDGVYMIQFDLYPSDIEGSKTYRVVSMGVVEPVDDFELTVSIRD